MAKPTKKKTSAPKAAAKKPTAAPKAEQKPAPAGVVKPGGAVDINLKDEPKGMPALPPKRKMGLRGAAPWAARHAAKHAAEARARAAEPAPPGSARATIRTPSDAENIKAKIAELHNQVSKIRNLRKRLDKGFFDIGGILTEIQQRELYVAKGYGSFEAFLEREMDLGKQTSLKLIKIAHLVQREAALDYGMDRLFNAIAALEGDVIMAKPSTPSAPGSLPLKPPMRIVG